MPLPNAGAINADLDIIQAKVDTVRNIVNLPSPPVGFAQGARLALAEMASPIERIKVWLEGAQDALDAD